MRLLYWDGTCFFDMSNLVWSQNALYVSCAMVCIFRAYILFLTLNIFSKNGNFEDIWQVCVVANVVQCEQLDHLGVT